MTHLAPLATMLLLPLVAVFFWVRGLLRARTGDLVAGLAILMVTCLLLTHLTGSSSVFSQMGCILIFFGAVTYGTSFVVKDNPRFKRQDVVLAAVVFAVLGFVGLIII